MWEQIRSNRRRSLLLLLSMGVLLIVVGCAFGVACIGGERGAELGCMVAGLIWLFQMLFCSAAGESILLSGLGVREISHEDSPRLFNVVEEMKIASGLEYLPRIYLIDTASPNAFAIGRTPKTSAIAVTSGLLYRLNRDELQGVIAHEIAHLKNLDAQFMTRAGVMLGSIVMLSDLGWQVLRLDGGRMRCRSSSREDSNPFQFVLFLLALLVMLLGPIAAELLYLACSRKREYLADACAAQFTRYPEGLASALEKISAAAMGLSHVSRAVAPMFIVNPLTIFTKGSNSIMSTHPETAERIRILRSMVGASLADYERAYRNAKGGRGLIGQASLEAAQRQAKRAASQEGPVEQRQETRSTVQRLYGYVEVECGCGMKMRVPQSYEAPQVHCIRCGQTLELPAARELAEQVQEKLAPKPQPEDKPLSYTRKSLGWETFRCACGGSIQLSPRFSARRVACPRCRRSIEVSSPQQAQLHG